MLGYASYSRAKPSGKHSGKPSGKPSGKKALRGYESDGDDHVEKTDNFEAQVVFTTLPNKSNAYARAVTVLAAALFGGVSAQDLLKYVAKARSHYNIVTGLLDFAFAWESDMGDEDKGVIKGAVDNVYEEILEDETAKTEVPDASELLRDAQRVFKLAREHYHEVEQAFINKYGESKEEAEAAFLILNHNFDYGSSLSFEADLDPRDVKRVVFAIPKLITNRKEFEDYVNSNCDSGYTNYFFSRERHHKRSRY